MQLLLSPIRFLIETLSEASTSNQMAWGFGLGMWVGLVPKDNLLAFFLMTVVYCLRVNLSAALMAAFLFSWIGYWVDPLTSLVGKQLLTFTALESMWTWLYNQPFVPWTNFNNTVVLGNFVVGGLLLLPVVKNIRPFFDWFTPKFRERVQKFRLVRVVQGADIVSSLGGDA